jgi:hypothetical protein
LELDSVIFRSKGWKEAPKVKVKRQKGKSWVWEIAVSELIYSCYGGFGSLGTGLPNVYLMQLMAGIFQSAFSQKRLIGICFTNQINIFLLTISFWYCLLECAHQSNGFASADRGCWDRRRSAMFSAAKLLLGLGVVGTLGLSLGATRQAAADICAPGFGSFQNPVVYQQPIYQPVYQQPVIYRPAPAPIFIAPGVRYIPAPVIVQPYRPLPKFGIDVRFDNWGGWGRDWDRRDNDRHDRDGRGRDHDRRW